VADFGRSSSWIFTSKKRRSPRLRTRRVGEDTLEAEERKTMEPLRVTLTKARETKNTVRYEEAETDQPLVIGTLYVHKWAAKRLEEPEVITVTIAAATK
jgi:hypothetical protein